MDPAALVDTDRWPLDDDALAGRLGQQFAREHVVVLPGFVRQDALPALVEECDRLARVAYHTTYNADLEVVAYDQFPADSAIRALYEWDPLMEFVARVLGQERLHRYADPFGALNLAVMRDGHELGWHFDQTDFVVSIAIQPSLGGGHFENVPQVRSADNPNETTVEAVRRGERDDLVRIEPMTPGTLMLFNGRWSLHRVSRVTGPVPRHVALLAYDTKPGTDSDDELKLGRYGRLPA
ncbi:MAG: hypothetical protein EBT79_05325 [Actinobacteria bacterium]|jgi:hypothetical protein|nr:hypothetical protein [Actinomycetota bacterium]NBR66692.1 hypothetical protein [Actinomycetota bacterium]